MKFLCVPCDEPMTLAEAAPPDRGSIALRYACDACGYEFAMLTNPFETQLVGSLGVNVGPEGADADAAGSKCPFSSMMQPGGELEASEPSQEHAPPASGSASSSEPAAAVSAVATAAGGLPWSADARERMNTVPEFVRPMAVSGIERFAREKGYTEIDERVLSEAREFFGMSV